MTKYFLPGLLAAVLLMQACNAPEPERILVFSKTAGPRHAAVEAGREALAQMAEANHWLIDTTENAELIAEENLQRYSAVVFLNTSGAFLNSFQQADLQRYIQAGGGFAGIHSACETEPDWAWFGELIGARPDRHETSAASGIQVIRDVKHPAIAKIPDGFSWTDEWYHFPELNAGAALLCTREDENKSVQPVSWFREFDGGRSFYTCVGHNPENFRDPVFLNTSKGVSNTPSAIMCAIIPKRPPPARPTRTGSSKFRWQIPSGWNPSNCPYCPTSISWSSSGAAN
ncbi:MAG TPA: ThuA domain-containing protein [Flavilitoribacter sp.]|nr:ThuA domain-containing protein [Flavilitoribacter sp.]